ncbi:MAG: glycosyltransferase family 4 protein [Bacteroidetes bacterium]|nr:glycosyltransferase family 4 protein [Bacteroidota bacterium]
MKLLVYSPDAWSVFFPHTNFIFGGIEIEAAHYARGLSEKGIEVTVVTRDHDEGMKMSGKVKVIGYPGMKGQGHWEKSRSLANKIKNRLAGEKRTVTLVEFIAQCDPDIIYLQGFSKQALEISEYAKKTKKKFILRIASDMDLGGKNFDQKETEEWNRISLEQLKNIVICSNHIFVQNRSQLEMLERFSAKGEVLYNPVDLEHHADNKIEKKYDALWVGKSSGVKRPELMLEIARIMKSNSFCMVCNRLDAEMHDRLKQSVPPNVNWLNTVPADQIESLFASSKLLINTSSFEGFPNTFLQAAKYGVPVISMNVDPEGMLSKHHAGIVAGDSLEKVIGETENILQQEEIYQRMSAAAKNYVTQFHDKKKIMERFYRVLQELSS